MNKNQIQVELLAQQQRRAAAQRAERERLEREQAAAKEIADADARIAQLQIQAAQADVEELLQENARFLATNQAAAAELLNGLSEIVQAISAQLPKVQNVDRTFNEQQGHRNRVMSAAEPLLRQAERGARASDPANQVMVDYERNGARQAMAYSIEQRIASALPLWAVLAIWVVEGANDTEKHIRQGIAHALFKDFPGVRFDATKQDILNDVERNNRYSRRMF